MREEFGVGTECPAYPEQNHDLRFLMSLRPFPVERGVSLLPLFLALYHGPEHKFEVGTFAAVFSPRFPSISLKRRNALVRSNDENLRFRLRNIGIPCFIRDTNSLRFYFSPSNSELV